MRVIIVGHYSRVSWIDKLANSFVGSLATIDYVGSNSFEGHKKALEIAAQFDERCVIMEDDAIPVKDFEQLAQTWFDKFPDELISFYLGTNRPFDYQVEIDRRIAVSTDGAITLNRLIHAVCYSPPRGSIPSLLRNLRHDETMADWAVGRAWGKQVIYPIESLVQHRDQGMVEPRHRNDPRPEPRVARHLAGPLMYGADEP